MIYIVCTLYRFPGLDYHNPTPDLFKPPQQSIPVSPEIDANSTEINGNGDHQEQPNDHQEHPLEPRDLYPRMPWHDVQACVSGLTARDCAAHFVQVTIIVTTIAFLCY